ncbi:hypothetical protein Csa_003104, partial [Cucumis sativus]
MDAKVGPCILAIAFFRACELGTLMPNSQIRGNIQFFSCNKKNYDRTFQYGDNKKNRFSFLSSETKTEDFSTSKRLIGLV